MLNLGPELVPGGLTHFESFLGLGGAGGVSDRPHTRLGLGLCLPRQNGLLTYSTGRRAGDISVSGPLAGARVRPQGPCYSVVVMQVLASDLRGLPC